MPGLIVCSKEKDPFSDELRGALDGQGVPYREAGIRHPRVIRELKNRGCTAHQPPVLPVSCGHRDPRFFASGDLFRDGVLVREAVPDSARM